MCRPGSDSRCTYPVDAHIRVIHPIPMSDYEFDRRSASIARRFLRRHSSSDPAAAALLLHALELPAPEGMSSGGEPGTYGYMMMSGYGVRDFFGLSGEWLKGGLPASIRNLATALDLHMAPRAGKPSFAGFHLAVDGSLFRINRTVWSVLAKSFAKDNPDLMDAACRQAASLGSDPQTEETGGQPDEIGEGPDTAKETAPEARDAPSIVVCRDLQRPARIEGLPESMQPSILEWSHLAEALPLQTLRDESGLPSMAGIEALRVDSPWMAPVLDVVERRLWLLRSVGREWTSLPPILIHGPSGIGKSYFARRLATALGMGFAETSLAGSTDNREMEGTARGWTNARPSWPVCSIARLRTANPLLFVDEVDKVDSNIQGDPLKTILTMIEPETASRYPDKGLAGVCDLSRVSWLLAANEVQLLGTALRDRIEIVTVASPGPEHLGRIVENVISDLARSLDVERDRLPGFGDLGMRRIEDVYASQRSLRGVARHVQNEMSRVVSVGARS